MGEDLEQHTITQLLALMPDAAHRKGDIPIAKPRGSNIAMEPYRKGLWTLQSKLPASEPPEAHLENLLSLLNPKQNVIRELAATTEIDFLCDVWDYNGFSLPPHIMQEIAELGASLGISIYS